MEVRMKFIFTIRKIFNRFLLKKCELNESEWRLQSQESFLKGMKLIKKEYKKYSDTWDHDHCAFCFDKFFEAPGYLHEGYATEDEYYWICETCFHDFKERFEWVIVEDSDDEC